MGYTSSVADNPQESPVTYIAVLLEAYETSLIVPLMSPLLSSDAIPQSLHYLPLWVEASIDQARNPGMNVKEGKKRI